MIIRSKRLIKVFVRQHSSIIPTRAARIMDEMEQKSIIGPYEGAKPRAVLISRQQWLEMQMNQPEE